MRLIIILINIFDSTNIYMMRLIAIKYFNRLTALIYRLKYLIAINV